MSPIPEQPELMPCPFCGKAVTVRTMATNYAEIVCCAALSAMNRADAITLWNRRSPSVSEPVPTTPALPIDDVLADTIDRAKLQLSTWGQISGIREPRPFVRDVDMLVTRDVKGGRDLADALTHCLDLTANTYALSHHRRLVAITLIHALDEIAELRARPSLVSEPVTATAPFDDVTVKLARDVVELRERAEKAEADRDEARRSRDVEWERAKVARASLRETAEPTRDMWIGGDEGAEAIERDAFRELTETFEKAAAPRQEPAAPTNKPIPDLMEALKASLKPLRPECAARQGPETATPTEDR